MVILAREQVGCWQARSLAARSLPHCMGRNKRVRPHHPIGVELRLPYVNFAIIIGPTLAVRIPTLDVAADAERRNDPIDSLVSLLRGRRFALLSGAGISTDSGIPDYRGPSGTLRKRQPMQLQEFLRDEDARRRYWSRSYLGWPKVAQSLPNSCHLAVTKLENSGRTTGLITQNVDGLHSAAGTAKLTELHGSLHWVRCLSCALRIPRTSLQDTLEQLNPGLPAKLFERVQAGDAELNPDGDAELSPLLARDFVVPACPQCHGVLKPDVVFFGENVPRSVVDSAWSMLDGATALVILGSSLAVYSGFRFAKGAHERDIPIAIVNQGRTRADSLAALCIDAPLHQVLGELVGALCPQ